MPESFSYQTITVNPLTRHIGAQISGIDLTRALSEQQVAELRRALLAHQVIFFRDQPISLDQHLTLGRHFGTLHVHPNTPGPEGYPEILRIHADERTKRIAGDRWHSDVSCDAEPPLVEMVSRRPVNRTAERSQSPSTLSRHELCGFLGTARHSQHPSATAKHNA